MCKYIGRLIDGIWVRAGLFAVPPDSERALDEFEFTLLNFIGSSKQELRRHRAARTKIKNIAEAAFRSHHTIDNKFGLNLSIKQRCAYPS